MDGGTIHSNDTLNHDSGFGYVKLEVRVRNLEQRWLVHSHFPLIP